MKYAVMFFSIYFIILIILYFVLYYINVKKNTLGLNKGLKYIVKKYDLNMNKERIRLLTKILVIVNSFILTLPITVFLSIEVNYYLILLISFVLFIILFLTLYNLIGVILKKKGW